MVSVGLSTQKEKCKELFDSQSFREILKPRSDGGFLCVEQVRTSIGYVIGWQVLVQLVGKQVKDVKFKQFLDVISRCARQVRTERLQER